MPEQNPKRLENIFGFGYFDYEFDDLFDPEFSYCALLWSHLSNEPGGTLRTCCIASDRIKDNRNQEFNLGEHSIREIFNSTHMRDLRNRIRANERITNCDTCWIDERNGKKSKRQQYNEYYKQWYGADAISWQHEPDKILDLQLIFDNTCNLKCRSCNANYSSKWREEAIDRKIPFWESSAKVDMNDTENSKFWTEMDDWIKDLRRLEIMGGEPFYMKEFKRFVEVLIEKDKAKDIALTLSTNGTIADKEFLDKIATNFKDVAFSVSIDGIGDRFNYLRHPAEWDSVKQNLDYFYSLHTGEHPVNIQITHTVTALNVMYLKEFHDYFNVHYPGIKIWNNIAHFPKWITPNVLPAKAKKHIIRKMESEDWTGMYRSEMNAIINLLKTPLYNNGESVSEDLRRKFTPERLQMFDERSAEKKWDIFKDQIVSGDLYRKENFVDTFPELYDLIRDTFDYESEIAKVKETGYTEYAVRDLIQ